MRLYHFYHNHRAGRLALTDFWLYELSMWLHALAYSLVAVFIPVLMLSAGYSITAVVGYYLVFNLIDAPLNFLARNLVIRYGARIVIVLATLSVIVFYWLLVGLTPGHWLSLVQLALFAALYDALYWVAHYYFFIGSVSSVRQGARSTGILYAVRQIALLVGPVIGAGILIFGDERILLYATIAVFALSLLPLVRIHGIPDKPESKPLSLKKFFATPSDRRPFISAAIFSLHDSVENTLFPVFIFTLFGTIQSVAVIPIVLSLTQVAIALVLGKLSPKRRETAIAAGALAIALIWAVRLTVPSTALYYASIFLVGLCSYFVVLPIDMAIFDHGRRVNDPLSAALYRNFGYMATNVLLYLVLFGFLDIFKPSFAIAATGVLCLALLNILPLFAKPDSVA